MSQRGQIRLAAGASLPVALALWFALRHALPPITADPMLLALQLSGAALFLAFLPVIEAVAHERLMSPAIDPLAGKDSPRLIVNQRVLQNTLEQSLVFVPALFLVAAICAPRRRAPSCG